MKFSILIIFIATVLTGCAKSPNEILELGNRYYFDENKHEEGCKWYEKLANDGYSLGQYYLGLCYSSGKGFEKNLIKAEYWYKKAANEGSSNAQYNLARLYENNDDHLNAVYWYKEAAYEGHPLAQNNLGNKYKKGKGVEQNYFIAFSWYKKSAVQSNATAQFNLGSMYEFGKGVQQDEERAIYWYEKAAAQGFDQAIARLNLIREKGSWHKILGSYSGWRGHFEIISEVKVNGLEIRHSIDQDGICESGNDNIIEINGIINSDTSLILERILKKIKECKRDNVVYATQVYLNSNGGYVDDGMKIGEVFRKYDTHARILSDQICASSCAIAFLGAKYREIVKGGTIMLHAPYIYTDGNIDCREGKVNRDLKKYYKKMLTAKDGDVIYDRTMNYCSVSDGWVVNASGAKIYNITN